MDYVGSKKAANKNWAQETGQFNIVLGGLHRSQRCSVLYPLIFALVASISDPMEIFKGNVWLWPKGFNLEAYKQVFRNGDIFTGYKNTLIYTVVGTLVTIIIIIQRGISAVPQKTVRTKQADGVFPVHNVFFGGMYPLT